MGNNTGNRLVFADLCRVLACFGVIVGHCSDGFVRNYIDLPLNDWLCSHFWGSVSRISSPLCILLSGSLLLKPNGTITFQDMKRRVLRILIPLGVWSCVYLCLVAWREKVSPFGLNFNQPEMGHLWFIYMMMGLYLFLPIFKALFDGFSNQRTFIYYFCFIWMAITCIPIHYPIEIFGWIKQPYFLGYGGYFLIGAFIAHVVKDFGSSRVWTALYIIGLSFTFFSVWYASFKAHTTVHDNYSLFSLSTTIAAISAFVLLSRVRSVPKILANLLAFISDKAFIIYFLHGFVLSFLHPIIIGNRTSIILLLPCWILATFVTCLGCGTILRYFPKSKLLFG
ncbi:acyltransferase [Candidatus Finniella inopinata]|uniref:Acyltransferase 3 domain-containing protein n=1 Tax=Candidatus Finniella inopinata TaxID=1696036 RepID=A0A4Q7DGZ8_9PROT|nr:acyltransferase family protein [Candidatus Finniella inopinata]RZI45369.1 hypothetical protein EQU50_07525 [Candidatus Finniella inopinata]